MPTVGPLWARLLALTAVVFNFLSSPWPSAVDTFYIVTHSHNMYMSLKCESDGKKNTS